MKKMTYRSIALALTAALLATFSVAPAFAQEESATKRKTKKAQVVKSDEGQGGGSADYITAQDCQNQGGTVQTVTYPGGLTTTVCTGIQLGAPPVVRN